MGGQVGDPLHRRKIARTLVAVDPATEIVEQRPPAGHPERHAQLGEIARLETERGKIGHTLAGQPGSQTGSVFLHRVGADEKSIELFQPGVLVRGEHAERLAHLGEHLVPLENHLILEIDEADALVGQGLCNPAVTLDGGRLVIAVGKHLVDPDLPGQLRNHLHRPAMAHQQPGPRAARRARQRIERVIELAHAVPDKLHPAVLSPRQGIKDVAVEHKHAIHALRIAQRVVQSSVIEVAKVAAEPYQCSAHERSWGQDVECIMSPVRLRGSTRKQCSAGVK